MIPSKEDLLRWKTVTSEPSGASTEPQDVVSMHVCDDDSNSQSVQLSGSVDDSIPSFSDINGSWSTVTRRHRPVSESRPATRVQKKTRMDKQVVRVVDAFLHQHQVADLSTVQKNLLNSVLQEAVDAGKIRPSMPASSGQPAVVTGHSGPTSHLAGRKRAMGGSLGALR